MLKVHKKKNLKKVLDILKVNNKETRRMLIDVVLGPLLLT